jgi:cyclase
MLKIRIIPILTFNGIALVKTKGFSSPRMVGNPVQSVRVYTQRGVDELIFSDINASRDGRLVDLNIIRNVLRNCNIPLGVGGGIRTIEDIRIVLKTGADKVVIKTAAMRDPAFVKMAASEFGSQAITVSVDAKKNESGGWDVWHPVLGTRPIDEFISELQENGAGELCLVSVDRDGMMNGFDIGLMKHVHARTSLPLIACGGAGDPEHFCELFREVNIEAAAAASIYHFTQYTPNDVKLALKTIGKPVRLTS